MNGPEVVEWLRSEPDAHAVEVVAALLRICHAEIDQLRERWTDRRFATGRRSLRKAIVTVLDREGGPRLDAPVLGRLAQLLIDGFVTLGVPYACHTVAVELDVAFGDRFGEYFDGDGAGAVERELNMGDPFPIHPAPTLKILTDRRDSPGRPDNLTAPLTSTPRLGIVTSTQGIRLRLTYLRSRLPQVHRDTSIAVVVTNHDRLDFSAAIYDEEKRTFTTMAAWTGSEGYFYGVRPGRFGTGDDEQLAAVVEQKRRIAQGLELASRAGSSIVVLPEFCSTDEIHAWILSLPETAKIPLLVAGSRHVATASGIGPGTNEAVVLVRGAPVVRFAKFTDFNLRLPAPDFPQVYFYEDLDRMPSIHVLVGSNTTAIGLICKDGMDAHVREVVHMLSPTLLLIPTMSPELQHLEVTARDLAFHPQTITVVANIGPTNALLGRPSMVDTIITRSSDAGRAIEMRPADGSCREL